MNEYKFDEIEVGMRASFQKRIIKEMEEDFRNMSGDRNPLHLDDKFAQEVSNGKIDRHVVFGMLTASLYSTLAGMYIPGKYSLIHSFDEISFLSPVYIGDNLIVEGEVVDKNKELKLIRINATIKSEDNKMVSRAKMKVLVMK